ncbi:MAG TPA: RelA/SpoT domain-containing protein [Geomonas sp.]|nr:RelA/SpoT domain-containing protein [Geomonas sp.]
MASLDFEQEKTNFRKFYEDNEKLLVEAKNAYLGILRSLFAHSETVEVTKIEGRVKDKEECVRKFHRKYLPRLEADEQQYEIKDCISDLIALRIVCLYKDQITLASEVLKRHFKILDITDKISAVEGTEDYFGYKGLHLDLALGDQLASQPKYQPYRNFTFEVQIRSLVQDAWSVLDHQIKYKKAIPVDLKRRITVLSALFELADREFQEIRNATRELLQQATVTEAPEGSSDDAGSLTAPAARPKPITAFNFLRVAGHFFREFEFEPTRVDNFVQNILELDAEFQKSDLHKCLNDNLKTVRDYRDYFLAENPGKTFTPYLMVRHCLYLYDKQTFRPILFKGTRERFTDWLKTLQENAN